MDGPEVVDPGLDVVRLLRSDNAGLTLALGLEMQ